MTDSRTAGTARPRRRGRRRATALGAVAVAGALALGACGGADPSSDAAGEEGPVELTFWSWMTNIEDVVDLWNAEHPDIQVTVDRLAEGDDLVTRILTAGEAGNLPDLMQAEYQSLPVLVSNGIAADITQDVADLQDQLSPGAWEQVTWAGSTFALPGDVAPLMLFYREDRFAELGVDVPATWDEFAAAAEAVRAADPASNLTAYSPDYSGWFAGMAQQAGADWWSTTDADEWVVDIDSAESRKVATYWGDLVGDGAVSTEATYSTDWNARLADGTLLAWVAPVWGAGVIEGIAPDTAGLWRAAPLPQWESGDDVTGFWGGSSVAVSAESEHHEAAVEFLTWLSTSPESTQALVDVAGVYPAAVAGQEYAGDTTTPAVLEGQDDFYQLAAHAASVARGFTWAPNVNATYQLMQDAFSAALEAGTPMVDRLAAIESGSRDDLQAQGYAVAAG